MTAVVDIEVNTESGKGSGVFYHILCAVHDDMRSHGHERMIRIHSDRMIRILSAGSRTACPDPAADTAGTVAAGGDRTKGLADSDFLCFCHSSCLTFGRKAILLLEDFLQLVLYLLVGELTIFRREI